MRKVSYRDVQEQITAVQEFNQGQTIWTSYRYDPLKQIVEVRDDRNHLTQASYDNLGRRVALDNPNTGKTERASGWEQVPGRVPGSTIYHPPGTDPNKGEHVRVMPPGSSAVPEFSKNGYWVQQNKHGQRIDPSTGKAARGQGDSHIPRPPAQGAETTGQ